MASLETLEVQNLTKSYGRHQVVKGVTFDVHAREVVGLLGPNGAGKTTSFLMTVGMIRPDAGHIYYKEEEITNTPMYLRARRGIGYLAQEPSIFQRLSVEDNLIAVFQTMGFPTEICRRRTAELLGKLGLSRLAGNMAYTLSGGERRRLEIARSQVTNPSFLLLDEPFSGVDPKTVSDIQQIIRTLANEGTGMLLTDHNVREALEVTDRAYIIDEGRIVAHGTPAQIVDNELVRQRYLGHEFRM